MSNAPRRPSSNPAGPSGSATGRGGQPPTGDRTGESRRGRRERERERQRARTRTTGLQRRSFFERHRGELLGLVAIAAIVFAGGFIVIQANANAYACTNLTLPAPAAASLPNGSPGPLGQVQPDMGRSHIAPSQFQRYTNCPPASGNHYPPPGGPIVARYYGPDDGTIPQGWIHNLEHGGLVILYSCDQGACDGATQAALQNLFATFPNSPVCNFPKGQIGPVITRFEVMQKPIAALLWGRILFQDKLDTAQILEFFRTQAELKNPEQQCARPSPSPASPAPSSSPGTSPSGSDGSSPSSGPSGSPGPSGAPSPSAS